MIHGKDRLQEYKRRIHAERKELQQATRSFITSVFRTGVSVALFPVSRLPRKPQQHFHAAGCEFTRGLASLAHGFADILRAIGPNPRYVKK